MLSTQTGPQVGALTRAHIRPRLSANHAHPSMGSWAMGVKGAYIGAPVAGQLTTFTDVKPGGGRVLTPGSELAT